MSTLLTLLAAIEAQAASLKASAESNEKMCAALRAALSTNTSVETTEKEPEEVSVERSAFWVEAEEVEIKDEEPPVVPTLLLTYTAPVENLPIRKTPNVLVEDSTIPGYVNSFILYEDTPFDSLESAVAALGEDHQLEMGENGFVRSVQDWTFKCVIEWQTYMDCVKAAYHYGLLSTAAKEYGTTLPTNEEALTRATTHLKLVAYKTFGLTAERIKQLQEIAAIYKSEDRKTEYLAVMNALAAPDLWIAMFGEITQEQMFAKYNVTDLDNLIEALDLSSEIDLLCRVMKKNLSSVRNVLDRLDEELLDTLVTEELERLKQNRFNAKKKASRILSKVAQKSRR